MSADPATVGARVLEALARGREKAVAAAQARGATTARAVRRALDVDVLEGHGERGRAGRIARRLKRGGVKITERGVRKILERLSSGSGSL